MKQTIYPKIVLLNYEGAVLTAHKHVNLFIVTDQWKEIVKIMLLEDMEAYVKGEFDIVDSKGKSWNYAKEHSGAKPQEEKLKEFLTVKFD